MKKQRTGRLTFAEIEALIGKRTGIRFMRNNIGSGTWYEYDRKGNIREAEYGRSLARCPLAKITEKDKAKKDWKVLQDLETGKVPKL